MTTAEEHSLSQVGTLVPASEGGTTTTRAGNPSRRKFFAIAATSVVVAGSAGWYALTAGRESTDDAQVDAEVVAVPARAAGIVTHIHFVENQSVKAGDVLATLEDDLAKARFAEADATFGSAQANADAAEADARVAEANANGNKAAASASLQSSSAAVSIAKDQIAEAEATRVSAEASLRQARTDVERDRGLYASGAITKAAMDQRETAFTIAQSNFDATVARLATLRSGIDQATGHVAEAAARAQQSNDVDSVVAQARARAKAARAQVATAQAVRDVAALDLSFTRIVAPHDGVVSRKTIAEGQAVTEGQPIVQLVTPGVWITANFKETQLERMHPGQRADVSVDAFPSARTLGEVESLSGGTGSRFTLLPPDNASGNYTKIVQRVPVRIRVVAMPPGVSLRPGMSVDVTVDTRR